MKTHLTCGVVAAALCLASCAGYRAGSNQPAQLSGIRTIAVPMFGNATQHPRAEALATSAVTDAIILDGTYLLAGSGQADAVLEGELRDIDYSTIRSTRFDTMRPEELANTVVLSWTLRDARDPTRILASGESRGSSQLFVANNLQTARNNALPEALERAGESLVSQLANGY
jgi:Lipopolysaccharide-assembly